MKVRGPPMKDAYAGGAMGGYGTGGYVFAMVASKACAGLVLEGLRGEDSHHGRSQVASRCS